MEELKEDLDHRAPKWLRFLEGSTNIAIALVLLTFGVGAAWHLSAPRIPRIISGWELGGRFPVLPEFDPSDSDRTLVVGLSAHRDYCLEVIPLVRRLVQDSPTSRLRVLLLFPSNESTTDVQSFLHNYDLALQPYVQVDFGVLRIPPPPTLVLVNHDGIMENFWIGRPSDSSNEELLRILGYEFDEK